MPVIRPTRLRRATRAAAAGRPAAGRRFGLCHADPLDSRVAAVLTRWITFGIDIQRAPAHEEIRWGRALTSRPLRLRPRGPIDGGPPYGESVRDEYPVRRRKLAWPVARRARRAHARTRQSAHWPATPATTTTATTRWSSRARWDTWSGAPMAKHSSRKRCGPRATGPADLRARALCVTSTLTSSSAYFPGPSQISDRLRWPSRTAPDACGHPWEPRCGTAIIGVPGPR